MPGSKTNKARKGVFISYAREDGTTFADLLRRKLKVEQIQLWRDREEMVGGRDWWLQIVEALNEVEFMALVVTPKALKSEIVRKEWRLARQEGVCVFPIKGSPDLDFASLPHWMGSSHFYDLGTAENDFDGPEWPRFVNDLNTRCQMRRVPFMVGDLPEGFIQRPDEFDRLHKLLCNAGREAPIAITTALQGAGGYGKTTLAKALCHDDQIQEVFDGGVLWIALGENPPNLTSLVEDLIVTLGDERPGFTTLDAAVNRFKELLADRDILFVIDDVWDRAHLNPFIQGGPRCARLITTRDLATLPTNAVRVRVDAMQQSEAVDLLAADFDKALTSVPIVIRELKLLAERLGEWPLLLRLVNSSLHNRVENDRQPLSGAIDWVNKALSNRGLTYFDAKKSEARHQAVATTIGVSLELLDKQERQRYCELAVFPEDIEIPLTTLAKLWAKTGGFNEFDTEELCSRLNRLSLLWSYDANLQRIRLHDVVRQFLIDQQPDRLPSIHTQLLDAHRPLGCWYELPSDEPYLWDHLAHHLVEAGLGDELVATVMDWRYLVAKTFMRKSLATEVDLLAAERTPKNDEALRLLRRNYVNSGHLLNRCTNQTEIKTTLYSRLQHLDDLKSLTTDLLHDLKRPVLVPSCKLPDLPHPALVRTLRGHRRRVRRCAVSADGATIVSASADKTLKVWDGRSGAERFTLSGHVGGVKSCAMSANGATIVSASADGALKVWDGWTGAVRLTLLGNGGKVRGCAVSVDGATIVSASADGTLKVWDGVSGAERFTLRGHATVVNDCALSADEGTIVSASADGTLKVWDGRSGAERLTLSGHAIRVSDCAVSADGATIVSASADGTLKVWDGVSGAERFTLRGHRGWVNGCAVSADGAMIVSASADETLKLWDGRTGAERLTLSGHGGRVRGCAVSADGATVVSASADGTLKVWDGGSGVDHLKLHGHVGWVNGCAVSADGATIVSASSGKTLKVWDGRSGKERRTLRGHVGRVRGCAVSTDGATIVSASADGTLKVWDGSSSAERLTLRGHVGWVRGCAVSANGATIVSASADGTLKVWDGRTGAELFTLRGHAGWVRGCAVSADGATMVSASDDRTVKVWDGRSGGERFTLSGHQASVMGCAVSADGVTIVSASADLMVKVWDGRTGAERFTLRGHGGRVTGCAVSADGTTIMSASADGTLKVWDSRTGKCCSTLYLDGSLIGCACSADGEIVFAVGARGVYFFRLIR